MATLPGTGGSQNPPSSTSGFQLLDIGGKMYAISQIQQIDVSGSNLDLTMPAGVVAITYASGAAAQAAYDEIFTYLSGTLNIVFTLTHQP